MCFTCVNVVLFKSQKVNAFSGPFFEAAKTTETTFTVIWTGTLEENESFFVSLNDNYIKIDENEDENTFEREYTFENLEPNTKYTAKVVVVNPYVKEGLLGDVNLDGRIDSFDFAWLRNYLLTDTIPITENMLTDKNEDGVINSIDAGLIKNNCLILADVNGDKHVDAVDFAMLKKKLLNGDNYFFPECITDKITVTKYTKTLDPLDGLFVQISASKFRTAALRQDGTVWEWGDNKVSVNQADLPITTPLQKVIDIYEDEIFWKEWFTSSY